MTAAYEPPTYRVDPRTLVFDRSNERQIMWLEGALPLPPGSIVEIYHPSHLPNHGTAIVDRVRLLAGGTVCLDCRVEPGWWSEDE